MQPDKPALLEYRQSDLPYPSPTMTTERFVKLPPLENGDRLTRTEFERRYTATSNFQGRGSN